MFITFKDVKHVIYFKHIVVSLLQQAIYSCLCLGQIVYQNVLLIIYHNYIAIGSSQHKTIRFNFLLSCIKNTNYTNKIRKWKQSSRHQKSLSQGLHFMFFTLAHSPIAKSIFFLFFSFEIELFKLGDTSRIKYLWLK